VFCILKNETLSGAVIPFSKMPCIILFFSVILRECVLDTWQVSQGKKKKTNSGTIFTLGRALQVYWETGF
jgi:cytochrome oxidase assembly protein ShyY1